MPADPKEVNDCEVEGIGIRDMLSPARVVVEDGRVVALSCTPMKAGDRDASGRPRPLPSGAPEVLVPADTVIVAIGQELEADFLAGLQIARRRDGTLEVDPGTGETSVPGLYAGGDVVRGASSVIKAIADGRAVAEAIGRRHGVVLPPEPLLEKQAAPGELMAKKGLTVLPQTVPSIPVAARTGFAEVLQTFSKEAAVAEASRCLDCDDLCSLCVTVCPNRANQAYPSAPLCLTLPTLVARGGRLEKGAPAAFRVEQAVQIVKIGDFCNDCGNCDTFCPTSGAPYKVKPTFWIEEEGFLEAKGDAYRLERRDGVLVLRARVGGKSHRLERRGGAAEYRSDQVTARFSAEPWELLDCEPAGLLEEGERIDLSTCAALITLLEAEPALPAAAPPPPGA
jgi:putative selenate reductase